MICDDAHSLAADGDDAAAGWTHCSEMYRNKDGHKKKKKSQHPNKHQEKAGFPNKHALFWCYCCSLATSFTQ